MTDDRIVLPLSKARVAAGTLCRLWCVGGRLGPELAVHADECLVPLIEQRDRMLAAEPMAGAVSGDCLDPVKHGACSGCACACHQPTRAAS